MKVYNQNKTQVLTKYDLSKGYLIADKIIISYTNPQPEIKEQFHYETIKEYANGGKDVRKVIDVPYSPAIPQQPIYEEIQVYVPYTIDELNEMSKVSKIERLSELTKDFAQVQAGLIIPNIEEKKKEFQTLLNEVRVLEGKSPRQIVGG